jgi:hypothetical protein
MLARDESDDASSKRAGERHSFEVSTAAGATWVQAQIASRDLDHPWQRFALD